MLVVLDTNVLVAAAIRQHPHFGRADAVLQRCVTGEDDAVIHAHSLLEFHSAVTQLPEGLSIPPPFVEGLLAEGILPFVRVVALTARRVAAVQKRAGQLGLLGGVIYDLYHLSVAEEQQVDRVYTFNVAHFRRLASADFVERIIAP